jgi:hypothetical protein
VRQRAWLSAVPKVPASQKVQDRNAGTKQLSRWDQMKKNGVNPVMPEVTCQYLANIYFEIGPVCAGGMGSAPITQTEIDAWQRNSGVRLQPWESQFVRRLSSVWIDESREAESPERRAPYSEIAMTTQQHVSNKIDEIFK